MRLFQHAIHQIYASMTTLRPELLPDDYLKFLDSWDLNLQQATDERIPHYLYRHLRTMLQALSTMQRSLNTFEVEHPDQYSVLKTILDEHTKGTNDQ